MSDVRCPISTVRCPLFASVRIIAAMRFGLALLFALPLWAQEPALTPFQEHKARTLLREKLPCLGCHELEGDGGRTAPSLRTVAERRSASYIRAIVEDPQAIVPGAAMPKTLMPQPTRDLVIRLLARNARAAPDSSVATQGPGSKPGTQHPAPSTQQPSTLYAKWCASCHGERGDGNGANARYLPVRPAMHSSAPVMKGRSDDALFDAIAGGGAIMAKSPRMPAFGATLTPTEIRSLVGYIRTLCNCAGPSWSTDGSNR